ncbi:hypothetical protein ACQPU1_02645 [Clostridium paraputrificum]|uniref:hypothetical protein n=1 Tax=Clostridium TaxID=1485 RepID=UPI003D33E960
MRKVSKLIIISCIVLLGIFVVSFLATDIYLDKKSKESDETSQSLSAGNDNKKLSLEDKTKISLFKKNSKEKETTLGELKKELGLDGEVTEEVLSTALQKKGYELDGKGDKELSYTREVESSVEPDKYYIKDYDGYLAIYKSDTNGNLTIENPITDVFKESKKFEDLPSTDRELINNLERKFDNKEDAEDGIYELIS